MPDASGIRTDAANDAPTARPKVRFVATEAYGALAATIVALPQALSLGVLAFAVLGPAYAGAGIVAGLLASVIGNLAATALPAVRCEIVGARSASTALVAGLMVALVAAPSMQLAGGPDVPRVIAFTFSAVVLAGMFQLAFGLTGLGAAVKYVPYPVIAGFMNGIALTIVLSQLRPMLGLVGHGSLAQTAHELAAVRWGSVVTTAVVLLGIFLLPRLTRRIPVLVGGLAAGIAAHYAIAALAPGAVGAVVGPLPSLLESFGDVGVVLAAVTSLGMVDHEIAALVLAQAVMIAVVASLDSLLAAVIVDGVTRSRHDAKRLLVGQGVGNVAGGLVGALPSVLNGHTPVANFHAGGRTPLSTFLHAVFLFLVLTLLAPLVAGVPVAALAGIMLYISWSLMDRWSGDLLRRARERHEDTAEVAANIAIVALVAAAQLAMNVIAALSVGVAISVALLLVKLSGSPVRRRLDGTARRSRKFRSRESSERLRSLASRIHVLELQGELFFGTADSLQSEVEAIGDDVRFVIIDFRRVHQIDATGVHVLQVIGQRAGRRAAQVLLSDVRLDERRGRYLRALGLDASIPLERWFPDLDRALEWAEDRLLDQARFEEAQAEIPPERMSLLDDLDPEQARRVAAALERIELHNGDPVFHEGDPGTCLYLIARGAVSIKTRIGSETRAQRLATYAPGVMFGEMAILAGMHRSADAYAKGDRVVLYALSVERLEEIVRGDPAAGARLHRNIARELAARVRSTTEALRALE